MRLSLPRGRHGPDGAAKTRGGSAVKRAACAAIACGAAVPLALGAHSDVQLTKQYTSPAWTNEFTQTYQSEECLYHAIRSAVPKGAPVYVSTPSSAHTQLLAELSTLWAVPQVDVARADWALDISHETLAGYLHRKHRRFMTYRYCPHGTLLSVTNLVQARQASQIGRRHNRKHRVRHR
jgi:hypothetical protein